MRIIIEDDNDNDVIELLKNGKVSASCYFNVNDNIIDVVYDEAVENENSDKNKDEGKDRTENYKAEQYKTEEYRSNQYEDEEYKSNQYQSEHFNSREYEADQYDINGTITVYSRLGGPNGALISSAKINLYMLNGISPRLIASKLTDKEGKVIFDNLLSGSYRVISIVDRKYFEKPTYLNWNEVTIDSNLYEETITVINRIKTGVHKGKRE